MSESIELEYKTLLSKQSYLKLIQTFSLLEENFSVQTNIYFDTKDFKLKKAGCGLRIRLFQHTAEATLKSPNDYGLLETTDNISLQVAHDAKENNQFPPTTHVKNKLEKLTINEKDLMIIGELTTKRAEISLTEGLVALDESWSANLHDYELEIEIPLAKKDNFDFMIFLNKFDLPYTPSENKIKRMLNAKH